MKEFKIKINNEIISVKEGVYITYYKMARHERYLDEVSLKKELSYNQLIDKEYPIEIKMIEPQKLIEDEVIEKIMIDKMTNNNEIIIINELFFLWKERKRIGKFNEYTKNNFTFKKLRLSIN